jgi:hypothetical protein
MFYVLQNESTAALRRVPILLTDAATGTTAQSGIALTTIFPYVNINGGAFIGGTGSVAEAGFGQYYYEMNVNETATLGLAGIHVTAQSCRNYDAIAQIAALNVYSSAGLGLTAGDVWEYDISAISTAGLAGKQLNDAATGGAGISAADVWNFDISSYSTPDVTAASKLYNVDYLASTYLDSSISNIPSSVWTTNLNLGYTIPDAGGYLQQLGTGATGFTPAGGAGLTVGDVSDAVWNAQTGSYEASGSFGLSVLRSDNAGIAGSVTVWTGASYNGVFADAYRIDGSYAAATALKDVLTGIGSSITSNITGDLSGSVGSVTADVNVSTASMAGVANTVWSTLTAPYTTHATFGHNVLRSDNAGTIGEVTLHQSGGSKRVDADVHAFVNNTASATAMLNILTGIGASITSNITGNLSGSVGSVTNPVSVTTASMTGIAGTVWNTDVSAFTSPSAGYDVHNGAGSAISAYDVWNFDPTAMTVPQAGAILTDIQTDTNQIQTDISNIPNNVWVSDVSGYTNPGEAGFELTQAALGGGGVTAGDIWTYASRTITGGIADTVTTLTDRSGFAITGGTITTVSDKTGYSLSGTQSFNLTGNITGSVSGSVGSVTGSVGSVVSAVSLSTATQASIANSVWLTDVTSYAAPSAGEDLATAAVGGISPADVWTYATRTITGGIADTVTTLTNRAGFAITGGTITTVSDKTGYSLSGTQSFNLTGNITGNVSGSVGSVSGAVGSVTGSVGSVAGNVVGSVASVTAPVSITTAAMGSIGSTIWNYVLSDAQSADTNLVAAGSGGVALTAGDVWTYNTRTLTSGAGITVIGAVQLVNGPYRLTSNQENSDFILDILQNSVQEINLNLVDGNGAPASTAGYAAGVAFYNAAGTLVTSYTPVVEYADGGVLTFEIDTAVTGTVGRYNLISTLSGAGFVVKYGPLQTLVRPF